MPEFTATSVPAQQEPPPERFPRITMSRSLRAFVWDITIGRCWYCGVHLNPFTEFCVDHIVPLAHGGSNDASNLVPSCFYCNNSKGTKTLDAWRVGFGRVHEGEDGEIGDGADRFFFERDDFWESRRREELRYYRRSHGRA